MVLVVEEQLFEVGKHTLVPKHELLTEEQEKKELEILDIKKNELPKIHAKDPAIKEIKAKRGSVIKVIRNSPTLGINITYRIVR